MLAGFTLTSLSLLVNLDEGYYLTASRFVYQGKIVYRDFFYTQMPLLPYIYGLWLKLFGYSWTSARLLGALISTALGSALFAFSFQQTRSLRVAWLAAILYAGSAFVQEWYPLAKTYGLTALGLTLATMQVMRAREQEEGTAKLFLGAGFLAGLTIDIRLMFLVGAGTLGLFCWKRGALPYLLGLGLALAPNLIYLALTPENYYFGNFGYHNIRTSAGLVGGFEEKWINLMKLVGLQRVDGVVGYQNALGLLLFGSAAYTKKVRAVPLLVGASLIFVSFLPTPNFNEYFCVAVPFLILACLPWMKEALEDKSWRVFLGLAVGCYLILLPLHLAFSFGLEAPYYEKAIGHIRRRLSTHAELRETIQQNTEPGDKILVSCPGYAFGTEREMFPKTENNFPHSLNIFPRLSEAQANEYQFLTDKQTEALISSGKVRLVVLGEGMRDSEAYIKRHYLLKENGFKVLFHEDALTVYGKKS